MVHSGVLEPGVTYLLFSFEKAWPFGFSQFPQCIGHCKCSAFISNYFNVYICSFWCMMGIMLLRSQRYHHIIIPINAHNASETEPEHLR